MVLVVTCVYKDDYNNVLRFCEKHNLKLVVYNKNDDLKVNEEIIKMKTPMFELIDIPNYGRCDYGFLYHIVKHYSDLPEKILFTKANFMDQNIQLDRAVDENRYDFTTIGSHIKYGIFDPDYNTHTLLSVGIHKNDIETFFYSKHDSPEFGDTFRSYIVRDFYKIVYGNYDNIPRNPVINMGHGPCFCVSRDLIKAHPKNIYENLMDTFYPDKDHWDPWIGHSDSVTQYHLGKRYHDNLLRFWSTLFIQNSGDYNVTTDYATFIGYKK
jgi:hypothetical protein